MIRPWRRMAGRFVIADSYRTERLFRPIYLASDFVCMEYVPGDYLEFGVYRGDSFVSACEAINNAAREWASKDRAHAAFTDAQRAERVKQSEIRFFAFDSFQGLPEPQEVEKLSSRFTKGRFDCSESEFRHILESRGVDLSKVVIVPGFYKDTLSQAVKDTFQLTAASIVMVDCDLYSSTKSVLDFITSLVVEGSIIIFDDWFAFKGNPNRGEQRACSEWLEANPGLELIPFARFGLTQQAFIVHKEERD